MTRPSKRTVIFLAVLALILTALCACSLSSSEKNRQTVNLISEKTLVPGGESIGVRMDVAGVLIVDLEGAAEYSGLKKGDKITAVDGIKVSNAQEVQKLVNRIRDSLELTVERNGSSRKYTIVPQKSGSDDTYRLGIWIKDKTAGIGTLTYYDPDNMTFGALGHPILDSETGTTLDIEKGDLLSSEIIGIEKGARGIPGEIQGVFKAPDKPLGELIKNTDYGIFGTADGMVSQKEAVPIACQAQVKEDGAYILTTLDDNTVRKYDVEIEKKEKQTCADTKSMVIHVTDKRLIEKCGGIVQGMSGSPIIQNGRLIGAITHVFVEDPTRGYAVYIEWMLEQSDSII